MKMLLSIGMLVMPGMAFAAADDCIVIEFSDHYEVVCEGDGKIVSVPNKDHVPSQVSVPTQAPDARNTLLQEVSTVPGRDASGSTEITTPFASQAPVPGATQRKRHGRPNTADRNAAIEARRKLIVEQRAKE